MKIQDQTSHGDSTADETDVENAGVRPTPKSAYDRAMSYLGDLKGFGDDATHFQRRLFDATDQAKSFKHDQVCERLDASDLARLSSLSPEEVARAQQIANHFVHRAFEQASTFSNEWLSLMERVVGAVNARQDEDEVDPDETQALLRALTVMLVSGEQVLIAFDGIMETCFDLTLVSDSVLHLERLIAEMEIYAQGLPQAIRRAKLHIDRPMWRVGHLVFRESAPQRARVLGDGSDRGTA